MSLCIVMNGKYCQCQPDDDEQPDSTRFCRQSEEVAGMQKNIARLEAECAALKADKNYLRDIVSMWLDMKSMDIGYQTEVDTEQWEKLCDIMLAALAAMQAGEKP